MNIICISKSRNEVSPKQWHDNKKLCQWCPKENWYQPRLGVVTALHLDYFLFNYVSKGCNSLWRNKGRNLTDSLTICIISSLVKMQLNWSVCLQWMSYSYSFYNPIQTFTNQYYVQKLNIFLFQKILIIPPPFFRSYSPLKISSTYTWWCYMYYFSRQTTPSVSLPAPSIW